MCVECYFIVMNETIRNALLKAVDLIHSDSNMLDAEVLLAHVLGIDKHDLFLKDPVISKAKEADFMQLVRRRAKGEPVAYIIGYKDFWEHSFKVSSDTLIPRPETESIVEAVIGLQKDKNASFEVLDLGAGTGCIALSILHEYGKAGATLVDINKGALEVAKYNAKQIGVYERCEFVRSDWFESLEKRGYDFIVSNPPYINITDEVGAGVREYEPHQALFAERDGLAAYLAIADGAGRFLKEDGCIILEIGKGQERDVCNLFRDYKCISAIKDFAGVVRVLVFSN